jgi:glycosyltransferase involved in cell wall biosynthesis
VGTPRILSVGRLVPKKGHDLLIRAAAALREDGVSFELRLAGDGVEWPQLQRLVHELGVADRVTFLGPLTPAEVREELAAAAVFALGCRKMPDGDRDGLPNVVLEAMAAELPIVSTTMAGVSEAVQDGLSGLLVAPEDPGALAAALRRVLDDPALALALGRGAGERVRAVFDRRETLPRVHTTLVRAGLVPPTRAAFAAAPARDGKPA